MSLMLLLTTIPASAITPTPAFTFPYGCAVTFKPIKAPAVGITTANSINNAL
jgi:hypothetical protein